MEYLQKYTAKKPFYRYRVPGYKRMEDLSSNPNAESRHELMEPMPYSTMEAHGDETCVIIPTQVAWHIQSFKLRPAPIASEAARRRN